MTYGEAPPPPARDTLEEWSPRLLRKPKVPVQCNVYELTKGSRSFILKDCSRRPLPFRLVARWILRRELRLLGLVKDVPGVPSALGWLDKNGLLIEHFEAVKLSMLKDRTIPLDFFDRLAELVRAMHECGVSHGDVSRSNVLIDGDDKPYLIDFATAWSRRSLLGRLLVGRVAFIDDLKVLRLRARYHPENLSEADELAVRRLPWDLRVGQFLRKRVYRPLKRVFSKPSVRHSKSE